MPRKSWRKRASRRPLAPCLRRGGNPARRCARCAASWPAFDDGSCHARGSPRARRLCRSAPCRDALPAARRALCLVLRRDGRGLPDRLAALRACRRSMTRSCALLAAGLRRGREHSASAEEATRLHPLAFYFGSVANLTRTKYRNIRQASLTEDGRGKCCTGSVIKMLVQGHVNNHSQASDFWSRTVCCIWKATSRSTAPRRSARGLDGGRLRRDVDLPERGCAGAQLRIIRRPSISTPSGPDWHAEYRAESA